MSNLLERLNAKGPKRILSLDGGGIRGILTLGFLEEMERILRVKSKNPLTGIFCMVAPRGIEPLLLG